MQQVDCKNSTIKSDNPGQPINKNINSIQVNKISIHNNEKLCGLLVK